MTNFEKIKQMSIEEMATFLEGVNEVEDSYCDEKYCPFHQINFACLNELEDYHGECRKAVLKWLSDDVE